MSFAAPAPNTTLVAVANSKRVTAGKTGENVWLVRGTAIMPATVSRHFT